MLQLINTRIFNDLFIFDWFLDSFLKLLIILSVKFLKIKYNFPKPEVSSSNCLFCWPTAQKPKDINISLFLSVRIVAKSFSKSAIVVPARYFVDPRTHLVICPCQQGSNLLINMVEHTVAVQTYCTVVQIELPAFWTSGKYNTLMNITVVTLSLKHHEWGV